MITDKLVGKLPSQSLDKAKILIVDDDESTRKILSLIFTRNKYEVESAVTGQEAVERAHNTFFDVVIMDIVLPDMEGINLIASLKELYPSIVVIIITAYPTIETAIRALNEGASAYITKPLNMNDVLRTISAALEKQHFEKARKALYESSQQELAKHENLESGLKYQAEMQKFIFSISLDFIKLIPEDVESGITTALGKIGEFTNADRCRVFLFSHDRISLSNTHEWCAEGVTRQKQYLEELYAVNLPWLMDRIRSLDSIYIPNMVNFPSQANAEKESLWLQDVHSLIFVPIACGDIILGFLELASLRVEKPLAEHNVLLAKNIAQIFANKLVNPRSGQLRVLVGEIEPFFSEEITFAKQYNMQLIGLAKDAKSLIELAAQHKPDVVIVDFTLPAKNTKKLIRRLKEIVPQVGILLVSHKLKDTACLTLAITSGAGGCISSNASQQQLMQAIKSVHCGQLVADLELAQRLLLEKGQPRKAAFASNPLNQRELNILRMASEGMTNKAIAEQLSVSKRTVDSYFCSIFGKLSATSRIQAINLAMKNSWLQSSESN